METWRELLATLTSDAQEKQRIAKELGVSPFTLTRWSQQNGSKPRLQNLLQLLDALPQHRQVLRELIIKEYPEFSSHLKDEQPVEISEQIPSRFYSQVMRAYTITPALQRFWSISTTIIQQALGQLKPHMLGMTISIAQCMPPVHGEVRSLRERIGRAVTSEGTLFQPRFIFLGIESLAGYVVSSGRPCTIQNRAESHSLLPAHWVEGEESATACPIMREGRIAGCLLVSSTRPHFFLPAREKLVQHYANLLVPLFGPEEFYALDDIHLRIMPSYQVQEPYTSELRNRISTLMLEATRKGQPINILAAERQVWQQIEETLLDISHDI